MSALHLALQATLALTLFVTLVNAGELLSLSRLISQATSPWHWTLLRGSYSAWPPLLMRLLDFLFLRHFHTLTVIFFLEGLLLAFFPHWTLGVLLILTHLLFQWRFRGVFNGGSDYMTMIIFIGLTLSFVRRDDPTTQNIGLLFIALTSTLSYFIAGVVKILNRHWRSGEAVKLFLKHSNYHVPRTLQNLSQKKGAAFLITWTVIAWECLSPLIWVIPHSSPYFLGLGLLFHLGNFWAFGLNRFVFTWAATYPAILYFTNQ